MTRSQFGDDLFALKRSLQAVSTPSELLRRGPLDACAPSYARLVSFKRLQRALLVFALKR
jgi:hypothetical protein